MAAQPAVDDPAPLRDYQRQALSDLRGSMKRGAKGPILVAPPGAGKTRVAAEVVKNALGKGNKVLMIAPRRELVYQPSATFSEQGIDHGLILSGEEPDGAAEVQVASWDTLRSWLKREQITVQDYGLTVIDEAHLTTQKRMDMLRHYWPGVPVIGLTATPARQQGASLGRFFDDLVFGPSMRELIGRGFLLEPSYYVPSRPDKSRMKLVGGDYTAESVARVMDNKPLIGDIISHWWRHASDRQTVLFAATVAHATHFRDRFRETGAKADLLHHSMPLTERQDVLKRIESGETQVVCNVDIVSLGWDQPSISCAIIARSTKSPIRYIQTTGRILRPHPGQEDALILDHAGVVDDLGLIDEERPWSLDTRETLAQRAERQKPMRTHRTCQQCGFVFQAASCPKCGWTPPTRSTAPRIVEGELQRLNGTPREWERTQRRQFFGELLGAAQPGVIKPEGYKRGWAVHAYKAKLKTLPWEDGAYKGVKPLEPSPETLGWVKHLQIKRARAAKKREKQA